MTKSVSAVALMRRTKQLRTARKAGKLPRPVVAARAAADIKRKKEAPDAAL